MLCFCGSPREIKKERRAPQILLCLNRVLDRFGGIEHPTIGTDDRTEGREVVLKGEVV